MVCYGGCHPESAYRRRRLSRWTGRNQGQWHSSSEETHARHGEADRKGIRPPARQSGAVLKRPATSAQAFQLVSFELLELQAGKMRRYAVQVNKLETRSSMATVSCIRLFYGFKTLPRSLSPIADSMLL